MLTWSRQQVDGDRSLSWGLCDVDLWSLNNGLLVQQWQRKIWWPQRWLQAPNFFQIKTKPHLIMAGLGWWAPAICTFFQHADLINMTMSVTILQLVQSLSVYILGTVCLFSSSGLVEWLLNSISKPVAKLGSTMPLLTLVQLQCYAVWAKPHCIPGWYIDANFPYIDRIICDSSIYSIVRV